ncbi:MAG: hypothetical protein KH349_07390, partial [Clostridium sp.]|nr:hypothetical protein [Clostridium sp.]
MDKVNDLIYTVHKKMLADDVTMFRKLRPSVLLRLIQEISIAHTEALGAGRAKTLLKNVELAGIRNAIVMSETPERIAERLPNFFDKILVDAPCSGEGMFRRHPETRAEWSPESPAGCAKRQSEILDRAAEMLRPGGRMVYSTCTMNRTENEDTVDAFLSRHADFSLEAFSL